MRPILNNWRILLLAMLIAWSGFAGAYHAERVPPDHESPMQLAKEIADHSGKLEKQCDHCCHGGSHTQALCSERLSFAESGKADFESEVSVRLHSRITPPITPPPQA